MCTPFSGIPCPGKLGVNLLAPFYTIEICETETQGYDFGIGHNIVENRWVPIHVPG